MPAPQLRLTTADHVEAIGMRVLRIAEDMASGSRHQGRSERLIEQAESRQRSIYGPQCAAANRQESIYEHLATG